VRTKRSAIIRGLGIAAWLLVGVACTVLTSWAGTWAYDRAFRRSVKLLSGPAWGRSKNFLGHKPEPAFWPIAVPSDWLSTPNQAFSSSGWGWVCRYGLTYGSVESECGEVRTGWPTAAMHRWERTTYRLGVGGAPNTSPTVSSIALHTGKPGENFGVKALPIAPIWPGFAVDTLFYAALAWGFWRGQVWLRRRWRRSRGRCPRCGYSLAGLAVSPAGAVCPECGQQCAAAL
jgi:hypothetical protein